MYEPVLYKETGVQIIQDSGVSLSGPLYIHSGFVGLSSIGLPNVYGACFVVGITSP